MADATPPPTGVGLPSALVLLPTFNERDNLPAVAGLLLALPNVRVLVIDDGSPDGTGLVADAIAAGSGGRLSVLHRTGPRGLGRSYLDGMRAALATDADVVLQMDADLSHDPKYVPDLIAGQSHPRHRHRLPVSERGERGELAAPAADAQHVRELVRAHGHRDGRARLHRRFPMLAPRRAGRAAARWHRVQRLFVPGRDAVPGARSRLHGHGSAHHLRRASNRGVQDLGGGDSRVDPHAVAFGLAPRLRIGDGTTRRDTIRPRRNPCQSPLPSPA